MAFSGEINLATGQMAKGMELYYTQESFTAGKFNTRYDFVGDRGVQILTPVTQPLNEYAVNDPLSDVLDGAVKVTRYGVLAEMEDRKQLMEMKKSYSFNISIEKRNRIDQKMMKEAGQMLRAQIEERVVPAYDKYALNAWANWTYTTGEPGEGIKTVTGAALTTATAVKAILDAETWFMNNGIPDSNRYCYVPASVFAVLRLDDMFVQGPEPSFIKETITKGTVGTIGSMTIIRIPDTYLVNNDKVGVWDNSDIQFIATHKDSVIRPDKINSKRILAGEANPFFDGWLLQGHYYFDAFVLAAKAAGVYVYRAA